PLLTIPPPPLLPLFPYTTLFRSLRIREDLYDLHSYTRVFVVSMGKAGHTMAQALEAQMGSLLEGVVATSVEPTPSSKLPICASRDRKSTRLNSSHQIISYAVFCL